jgi:DNA mismatch endonuclease (patch repair protein)
MDTVSPEIRSKIMAQVRGHANRSTEIRLIKTFRLHGIIGWRRNSRLPGKPDFVFPKRRLAVFVDGCFWHCCPKHGSYPKQHAAYWKRKLVANMLRDKLVTQTLRKLGWRVMRFWEHELRAESKCARKIARALNTLS